MFDLIEFIKVYIEPCDFPYFLPLVREQQIAWRKAGYRAWREGAISFSDFLRNLLPGRFKTQGLKDNIQVALDREIEAIFTKENLMQQPKPALFGNPFYPTNPASFPSWLIAMILVKQIAIDDQYHIKKYIGRDAIVIDAGANIGVFSTCAATAAPDGRVYAFEPTASTFRALEKNLKPHPNVTAIRSALGNRGGQAELLINASLDAGNSLAESNMPPDLIERLYHTKETVPITTIDNFVREKNLARVDFIKIDTEGFERQILEGAAETIRKYRPTLVLAAYHKPGDPDRFITMITSYDRQYQCNIEAGPELDLVCHV